MPALDGVRAIAIAGVLADHGGVSGLSGGFIGVDVFFVLSGFLITSLLLAEQRRSGRIDLAGFWTRRARRLLPALVVMVVVVGLARGLFPGDAVAGLRFDALAALGWVANWRFAAERTDYFAQGGTASPLQHTWSLGVEEQYYLLWPMILVAVAASVAFTFRRRPTAGPRDVDLDRRVVAAVAAIGAVGSAITTVALAFQGRLARVYFGTDTRAQALLLGALTAALLTRQWSAAVDGDRSGSIANRRTSSRATMVGRFLLVGGLTALGITVITATGDVAEFRDGLPTGVALAASAVVAGVLLDRRGPLTRLLGAGPMVALGRISYGVYLWHWPTFLVLDGARTHLTGPPLFLVRCAVTLVLALASWLLIERPAHRWRARPRRVLPAAALAVVLAAGLIAVTVPTGTDVDPLANVLPPGLSAASLPSATVAQLTGGAGPSKPPKRPAGRNAATTLTSAPAARTRATGNPASGEAGKASASTGRRRTPPLKIDVFGDSIAWTMMRYLPSTPGLDFVDRTALGCGVAAGGPYRYFGDLTDQRPECDAWPRTWAAELAADHPDVVLLLVGRWETMDRMHGGAWTHLGDAPFDTYLSAQLSAAFALLRKTGAQLVVATEPFNRRGEQADGSLYPEDEPGRVDRWNTLVRAAVATVPGVDVLDLNKKLCPDGTYTQDVDGLRVRSDGVHLTPAGAAWLTPWLVGSLTSFAR